MLHHPARRAAGARRVDDAVGVVALCIGGVGRHGDAARGHDRQVADAPFGTVLADQHDAVPRRETDRLEPGGEARHLARRLGPALRHPAAVLLVPQERRVAFLPCARQEHGDQAWEMFQRSHPSLPGGPRRVRLRRAVGYSAGRLGTAPARTMLVTLPSSPIATPSLRGSAAPPQRPWTRSIALDISPSGAPSLDSPRARSAGTIASSWVFFSATAVLPGA